MSLDTLEEMMPTFTEDEAAQIIDFVVALRKKNQEDLSDSVQAFERMQKMRTNVSQDFDYDKELLKSLEEKYGHHD